MSYPRACSHCVSVGSSKRDRSIADEAEASGLLVANDDRQIFGAQTARHQRLILSFISQIFQRAFGVLPTPREVIISRFRLVSMASTTERYPLKPFPLTSHTNWRERSGYGRRCVHKKASTSIEIPFRMSDLDWKL